MISAHRFGLSKANDGADMTTEELQRLDMLSRKPSCVPKDYVHEYYGLRFGDHLREVYDRWQSTSSRRDRCGNGQIDRAVLETFLQNQKMLPYRWMGASLGMTEASLREVLARKEEI